MKYNKVLFFIGLFTVLTLINGYSIVSAEEQKPSIPENMMGVRPNAGWQGQIGGPKGDLRTPGPMLRFSGVAGAVTAISGSTITLKANQNNTTYTVDATNAKVRTDASTSATISDIKVGDTIVVEGKVTGTDVVATIIIEGKFGEGFPGGMMGLGQGTIFQGTVATIGSTTFTITAIDGTVYTVDATNAKIGKEKNTDAKLTDITIGDSIAVVGTLTGNTIYATRIADTKFLIPKDGQKSEKKDTHQGIVGTISVLNGNTLTLDAKNGTTYTVDATNAQIKKDPNTVLQITDIKVGDTVIVQGTVTDTTIAATTIFDGFMPKINKTSDQLNGQNAAKENHPGFFSRIGNFFKNLFGRHK